MAYKNETEDKEKIDIPDNEHEDREESPDKKGHDDILLEARQRYQRAVKAELPNAADALEDDMFMAGRNQWPVEIQREREEEGRPCLTINKLTQFKNQVFNSIRQNTPTIKVTPAAGSNNDKFTGASGKQYTRAQILQGLTKNIESQSRATKSYDHATGQAIDGGWGYFRAVTQYVEGAFDQEIRIKRIKNRFSVKLDPNTNESDRSDAKWAFISEFMPLAEFNDTFPDAMRNDMDTVTGEALTAWYEDGAVRVAEYYRIVKDKKEIALLSDNRVIDWDEDAKLVQDELLAQGIKVVDTRMAELNKVEWYKITGATILEGPIEIPCKFIPIAMVIGTERILDGEVILEGLTRQAKDSVRQYNYWRTAETESVALQPKQPFIMGSSQVGEFKHLWANANKENAATLIFDDAVNSTAPQRQQPPLASSGNLNAAKAASDDLKSTMGMFDPSVDTRAKEKSGKAIQLQEMQASSGNFHFSDNQAEAVEHMGRIIIDMIPKVYDGNRIIRTKFDDGSEDDVELYQTIVDEETGEEVMVNDLSIGTFEVAVTVGPSYLTQRMEAVESLMSVFKQVPRAGDVGVDLLAKNLDIPEADELHKRLRKTAPQGVIEYANDEEKPKPPEPTPEQQAEMAKAQATMATAEADKAQAEAKLAEANITMMQLGQEGESQGQPALTEADIARIVDERVEAGIQELIEISSK